MGLRVQQAPHARAAPGRGAAAALRGRAGPSYPRNPGAAPALAPLASARCGGAGAVRAPTAEVEVQGEVPPTTHPLVGGLLARWSPRARSVRRLARLRVAVCERGSILPPAEGALRGARVRVCGLASLGRSCKDREIPARGGSSAAWRLEAAAGETGRRTTAQALSLAPH